MSGLVSFGVKRLAGLRRSSATASGVCITAVYQIGVIIKAKQIQARTVFYLPGLSLTI